MQGILGMVCYNLTISIHHINQQLDRSIRDFQDALQGLVTRNLGSAVVAMALGLTERGLAQMRRQAKTASPQPSASSQQARIRLIIPSCGSRRRMQVEWLNYT